MKILSYILRNNYIYIFPSFCVVPYIIMLYIFIDYVDAVPVAEDTMSLSYVRLPNRYTAMKGDIAVTFNIGDGELLNLTTLRYEL